MARFAGQALQATPGIQKPVLPSFNAEDLQETPEMRPGPYYPGQDLMRDKYIRQNPKSGVAMLPNGEQGPAQGPNIPIKNYGGRYMPDGSQPSGYKHGPVALAPALVNGIGAAIKGYSAYRTGKAIGDGIRDPQTMRDRGGVGMGRITGDLMDGRKERTDGPTLRSPYHQ